MFNLVIFGGPGSGKGTQSDLLIEEYGLFHISTGEVLRDQISRGTELGKIADSFISGGNLIPDDLMISILGKVLDENADKVANGVIFDGFPRTIDQAKALTTLLEERNMKLNVVIGLEVADEELTKRLIKRGQDSGRSDDNAETIKKRLDVYHNQTSPLRDFYINEGVYAAIEGNGSIADIFADIKVAVEKVQLLVQPEVQQ